MKALKNRFIKGVLFIFFASLLGACSSAPSAEEIAAQKEKERQRQLQRADDSYKELSEETKPNTTSE